MSSFRKDKEPSFLDKVKGMSAVTAVQALPAVAAYPALSSILSSPSVRESTKNPSPLFKELERLYLSDSRFGDTRSIAESVVDSKPYSRQRFVKIFKPLERPHVRLTQKGTEIHNVGNLTNFDSGILAHEMGHAQKFTEVSQKGQFALLKYIFRNRELRNLGGLVGAATLGTLPLLSDDAQNIGAVGSSALIATVIPDELRASYRGSKLLSEAAKNTGTKLSLLKRLSSFKGVPRYVASTSVPILGLQAYRHFTKKSSLNNRYYEGEGISGYMNPWNVANPKRLYLNRDNAVNLGIVAGTGLAGRVVGGIAGTRIGRRIGEHNVAAMKPKVPQSRVTFGPAVPMADNVNPPALKGSVSYAVNRRVIPKLKRGDRLIRSIGRLGGSRGRMIGTGLGLTLGYLGLKRKERKPSILDFNNWLKR